MAWYRKMQDPKDMEDFQDDIEINLPNAVVTNNQGFQKADYNKTVTSSNRNRKTKGLFQSY